MPSNIQDAQKGWALTTLARLYISDLLKEYDKCIYLDGDTIILDDLSDLYSVELGDNCIAGVRATNANYNIAAEKELIFDRDLFLRKHVNAGVLVMNLKRIREMGGSSYIFNEYMNIVSKFPKGTSVTDQIIINKIFVNKIVYLPLKYNFYIESIYIFNKLKYTLPFLFDKKTIIEAFNSPSILHYCWYKPWKDANAQEETAMPYKKYLNVWSYYYSLSPFGKNKIEFDKKVFVRPSVRGIVKKVLKRIFFKFNITRKETSYDINELFI